MVARGAASGPEAWAGLATILREVSGLRQAAADAGTTRTGAGAFEPTTTARPSTWPRASPTTRDRARWSSARRWSTRRATLRWLTAASGWSSSRACRARWTCSRRRGQAEARRRRDRHRLGSPRRSKIDLDASLETTTDARHDGTPRRPVPGIQERSTAPPVRRGGRRRDAGGVRPPGGHRFSKAVSHRGRTRRCRGGTRWRGPDRLHLRDPAPPPGRAPGPTDGGWNGPECAAGGPRRALRRQHQPRADLRLADQDPRGRRADPAREHPVRVELAGGVRRSWAREPAGCPGLLDRARGLRGAYRLLPVLYVDAAESPIALRRVGPTCRSQERRAERRRARRGERAQGERRRRQGPPGAGVAPGARPAGRTLGRRSPIEQQPRDGI